MMRALLISLFLAGCTSAPPPARDPGSEAPAFPTAKMEHLMAQLGMTRDPLSLGFTEKSFNGCKYGLKCVSQFLTVVNFRVVCRDSEDTVSEVAKNFRPLISNKVTWKMAGQNGATKTDTQGYGQVQTLSESSLKGQRLVLIAGKQFLGLEVNEVAQIVVPTYWCSPR